MIGDGDDECRVPKDLKDVFESESEVLLLVELFPHLLAAHDWVTTSRHIIGDVGDERLHLWRNDGHRGSEERGEVCRMVVRRRRKCVMRTVKWKEISVFVMTTNCNINDQSSVIELAAALNMATAKHFLPDHF